MDAGDLRGGFRLGEWLVAPRESRLKGAGGERVLTATQVELLLALAERHGASVSRRDLRQRLGSGGSAADALLRRTVRELRYALGGSVRDRRYLIGGEGAGFALVAPLEPLDPSGLTPTAGRPADARPGPAPAGHPTLAGSLHALFLELRRRSVLKVVGAYLVGMWLVLQVAETTFEPLRLPDWWMTALTILAVVGLPIVTALAWSYEITPGGIVLDSGAPHGVRLPRARRSLAPAIVLGVALMAGVTGYAWWLTIANQPGHADRALDDSARPSIAVLPLADMSASGNSGYLGDGLAEELSARLAQIPGLRVAARTSAFEFKDRSVDVRRIGAALGVRHVLEGSVRRDGNNLRVTVQLIDASNGYHIWAHSYDRAWSDVIAIQDDISRAITDTLRVVLKPAAQPGGAATGSPDVRALDPYLAGLAMLRKSPDMSRLREAEQRFQEAVEIDAGFARAHAGLCQVEVRIYDRTRDPADRDRAEDSCRESLRLDPTLVEVEKGLGELYLASGRPGEAEAMYRALVARNPQDADGHIGLARALESTGRFDVAEASYRKAVAVEPAFWGGYNRLGTFLLSRGDMAAAIVAFREVTALTPSSATAYNNYGAALQLSGDLEGAAEAFRQSLDIEPSKGAYSNLGTTYYFLHQFADAAASYERATAVARQDHVLWGNLGDALAQIPGRRPEALGHYRRAIGLAERELGDGSDGNALLQAMLAYYYRQVGDAERSDRYLERAVGSGSAAPYVAYYAALTRALAGDAPAALRYESMALDNGYPRFLIEADPVLRPQSTDRGERGG